MVLIHPVSNERPCLAWKYTVQRLDEIWCIIMQSDKGLYFLEKNIDVLELNTLDIMIVTLQVIEDLQQ